MSYNIGMKKFIPIFAVVILTIAFLCVWTGCSEKETFVYTLSEEGRAYTLTLDEKEMTFVLSTEKEGKTTEYAGEYFYQEGSIVLYNDTLGYRSVGVNGDNFFFLTNPEGLEEKVLPCEHVWGEGTYTQGTCRKYGYTVFTCQKCGETKKETDGTYGDHDLDGGRHYEGATCADYGYTVYTCRICKEYTERVDDPESSDNHRYQPTETIRDDGCDTALKRLYVCSKCGAEKYMQEDSKAIGAHKDENEDGVCDVCGRLKNGFSTQHKDNDEDGKCDICKVKMSVLEGVLRFPSGYEEEGKVYLGFYPQTVAPQSVKDIRANGLYDEGNDLWYYGSESYVLRKTGSGSYGERTFLGNGQAVENNVEYAFLLQPLAFVRIGDRYVCDGIIDAGAFQQDYAVIGGYSNEWDSSTISKYLTDVFLVRSGLSERAESAMLPTEADVSDMTKQKSVSDYALAGGVLYYGWGSERKGDWLTMTPAEGNDSVKCVVYSGVIEDVPVTYIRGIVPIIRLKEGE